MTSWQANQSSWDSQNMVIKPHWGLFCIYRYLKRTKAQYAWDATLATLIRKFKHMRRKIFNALQQQQNNQQFIISNHFRLLWLLLWLNSIKSCLYECLLLCVTLKSFCIWFLHDLWCLLDLNLYKQKTSQNLFYHLNGLHCDFWTKKIIFPSFWHFTRTSHELVQWWP